MSDRATVASSPCGEDATAYLYDGSFEGLMTAVFEAFAHRPMPDGIWEAEGYQPQFGERTTEVTADITKADRVIAGIRKIMGSEAYERVWLTFLSEQRERGNWIYAYIRLGMEQGRRIHRLLTDRRVMTICKWSGLVSTESHRFLQFVRFSKREGGVYYAGIRPAYDIVALLMPHFVQRLNIQPFVIHDKTRGLLGVFDTKEWVITQADNIVIPAPAEEDLDYQQLWKTFYNTVAIRERTNPRCRMHFMPKKYWRDITEMQDFPDREHTIFVPRILKAEPEPILYSGEPASQLPLPGDPATDLQTAHEPGVGAPTQPEPPAHIDD